MGEFKGLTTKQYDNHVDNVDDHFLPAVGVAVGAAEIAGKAGKTIGGIFKKKKKPALPRLQLTPDILQGLKNHPTFREQFSKNPEMIKQIQSGNQNVIRVLEENLYILRQENPARFDALVSGEAKPATALTVPALNGKNMVVPSSGNIFKDIINSILALFGLNSYEGTYDNLTEAEKSAAVKKFLTLPVSQRAQALKNYTENLNKKKVAARLQAGAAKLSPEQKAKVKTVMEKGTPEQKMKVVSEIKKIAVSSPFDELLPYRSTMVTLLKQMGINVPNSAPIRAVGNVFYNEIVTKADKSFTKIDVFMVADSADQSIQTATEKAVVSGILSYIQSARDKQAEGKPLTKAEQIVASATEEAETQIKEGVQEKAALEVGKSLLFNRGVQLVIVIIVGFVIYKLVRRGQ